MHFINQKNLIMLLQSINGRFQVTTKSGEILDAESVICATGSFHRPYVPDIPGLAEFRGEGLNNY
ncbi:hypothetical protein GC098_02060 [Paenibacillus sp. LMG 31458]|uniref:FAD/NAD(P)-binding domain-containing protein n=1 Tax=Paenibacillus phytorum TaxID=2654977 RepID=A0ABX1XNZ5_9BACL|nr:hypothetical protein [Paenibacillus phytorum]